MAQRIEFEGQVHDFPDDFTDADIAKALSAQPKTEQKPSGIIAAAQKGVSDLISGPAETLKQFTGADTSAADVKAQAIAPKDYKAARIIPEGARVTDLSKYQLSALPQIMAEAAPGMAQDIAVAKMASRAGKLAGLLGGAGSYLLRTRGNAAKENAQFRTDDVNAEPNAEDKTRALVAGVPEAALNSVGLGRFLPGAGKVTAVGSKGVAQAAKEFGKTVSTEAATEAAQDVVAQTGKSLGTDKGLTIDPASVVESAIAGGATAGALKTPRAVADVRDAHQYREFGGKNEEAVSDVADMARKAAAGAKLTNSKTAFEALRTVDGRVRKEVRAAAKGAKDVVSDDAADALERAGKGQTLTEADLSTIEQEAPEAAQLARRAHVVAMLKQQGDYGRGEFKGGITNAATKRIYAFSKMPAVAISAGASAAGLAPHAASMFAYGPGTLAALGGTYAAMRGIDRMTGNRSPLNKFVKRFARDGVTRTSASPDDDQTDAQLPSAPGIGSSPAQPWGPVKPGGPWDFQMEPEGEGAPLSKVLRANASVEEGIGKIASQIERGQQAKQKQTQAQTMQLLKQLAAQQKAAQLAAQASAAPAEPQVDLPSVFKQTKTLVSGLENVRKMRARQEAETPAPTPAVPAEPTEAAPVATPVLDTAVLRQARTLMSGLNKVKKVRDKAEAATAKAVAKEEKSRALEAAKVEKAEAKKLAAAARASAKITKKNGKIKADRPPVEDSSYTPLTAEELWGKGLSDDAFASQAVPKETAVFLRDRYANAIKRDRTKRRSSIIDVISDFDVADQEMAADLLEELHHTRRIEKAQKAIRHFTEKMTPEAAAAVRAKLNKEWVHGIWTK